MSSSRPNPRVWKPVPHATGSRGRGLFHRARHRRGVSVWDLRTREHNAWWFVRPIRQARSRESQRPILEQINQFGDTIYLGRL